MALAATAIHHHRDPRIAATIVSGRLTTKILTTATFPGKESGRTSATDGTRAQVQKKARQVIPTQPTTVLRWLTFFMALFYDGKHASEFPDFTGVTLFRFTYSGP